MPRWRVYYDDGSTFSDEDGAPEDAPAHGIQAIVQHDPDVGRHVISRFDWYFYNHTEGEWYGVDWFGMIDWFMRSNSLKAGRTVGNAAHAEVIRRAIEDSDFPRKSGRRQGERT